MKPVALKMKYASALVIGGILAAGPVMADKPSPATLFVYDLLYLR